MQSWTGMQRGCGILIWRNLQTSTGQNPEQNAATLESALFQAGSWTGDLQGSTLPLLSDYSIRQGRNVAPHKACFILIALECPTYKNSSVPQPRPCWQRYFIAGSVWWDVAPFEVHPFPKAYRNKQWQQIKKDASSYAFSYSIPLRLPESPRDPREFNEQAYRCAVK